jgi:hypothetical protein
MADKSSRASCASRPIGPSTLNGENPKARRSLATVPADGLMPVIPLKEAGVRRLPAKSDPMASGTMPEASATAVPPEDPAAVKRGSCGLQVVPQSGFAEVAPKPSSGTLVLPTTMAPWRRR